MYNKINLSLALDHRIGQTAFTGASNLRSEGDEIIAVHVYEPLIGSEKTFVTIEMVARAPKSAKDSLAKGCGRP
jgi:hypothetical protein